MFFKASKKINLVKLYFSPESWDDLFDFKKFSDIFLSESEGLPSQFSVNYKAERDISLISRYTSHLKFEDVQCLFLFESQKKLMFSISQVVQRTVDNDGIFECGMVSLNDDSYLQEMKIMTDFANLFDLHYGYGRTLRDDYFPLTETKIKRTLFGGSEIAVRKTENTWLQLPKLIRSGSIKGIYPLNFWSDKAISKLKNIDFNLPSNRIIESGVIAFSKAECVEISERNQKHTKYMHFSDTD